MPVAINTPLLATDIHRIWEAFIHFSTPCATHRHNLDSRLHVHDSTGRRLNNDEIRWKSFHNFETRVRNLISSRPFLLQVLDADALGSKVPALRLSYLSLPSLLAHICRSTSSSSPSACPSYWPSPCHISSFCNGSLLAPLGRRHLCGA